uniref:Uncharacterized protein n=1 Tax=Pseudictyota dubia TaxID=2749911 RepID=A0A7R9Z763_9STRA|mmetsp:Transcript_26112/g.48670  ORF Transcript_26112/g.48670 Transcript_26112/m.48670 type:complete len:532 (+) Transcript_26112:75-1670(+)
MIFLVFACWIAALTPGALGSATPEFSSRPHNGLVVSPYNNPRRANQNPSKKNDIRDLELIPHRDLANSNGNQLYEAQYLIYFGLEFVPCEDSEYILEITCDDRANEAIFLPDESTVWDSPTCRSKDQTTIECVVSGINKPFEYEAYIAMKCVGSDTATLNIATAEVLGGCYRCHPSGKDTRILTFFSRICNDVDRPTYLSFLSSPDELVCIDRSFSDEQFFNTSMGSCSSFKDWREDCGNGMGWDGVPNNDSPSSIFESLALQLGPSHEIPPSCVFVSEEDRNEHFDTSLSVEYSVLASMSYELCTADSGTIKATCGQGGTINLLPGGEQASLCFEDPKDTGSVICSLEQGADYLYFHVSCSGDNLEALAVSSKWDPNRVECSENYSGYLSLDVDQVCRDDNDDSFLLDVANVCFPIESTEVFVDPTTDFFGDCRLWQTDSSIWGFSGRVSVASPVVASLPASHLGTAPGCLSSVRAKRGEQGSTGGSGHGSTNVGFGTELANLGDSQSSAVGQHVFASVSGLLSVVALLI